MFGVILASPSLFAAGGRSCASGETDKSGATGEDEGRPERRRQWSGRLLGAERLLISGRQWRERRGAQPIHDDHTSRNRGATADQVAFWRGLVASPHRERSSGAATPSFRAPRRSRNDHAFVLHVPRRYCCESSPTRLAR